MDLDTPLWPGTPRNPPAVTHLHPAGPEGPDQEPAPPPHPFPAGPFPADPQPAARDTRQTDAPAAPAPRTSRLLRPEDYLTEPDEPPQMGWRSAAWRLGMQRIRPGRREQEHWSWQEMIREPVTSPKIIAVFSPKGGVGKSTTALQLGHVLAMVRGDLAVALDANPDSGNLVKRMKEPHSRRSADDLHRDAERLHRYTDLLPYLTRADSGLCVVRSNPDASTRLGPDEYRRILQVLSQYYAFTVADLGTGMREPAFLAIMEAADALVAVTEPAFDAAEVAIEGIDWLNQQFPEKIRAGTVVINSVRAGSAPIDAGRLAGDFDLYVDQVLEVPHDPHLATGGVPRWPLLARSAQDAYLKLTSTIVDLLQPASG